MEAWLAPADTPTATLSASLLLLLPFLLLVLLLLLLLYPRTSCTRVEPARGASARCQKEGRNAMLQVVDDKEISRNELSKSFEDLSMDAIGAIMLHLSVYDVLNCMLVNRAWRIIFESDGLWERMCKQWAEFTTIERWIITDEQMRKDQICQGCLPPPKNYRCGTQAPRAIQPFSYNPLP
jgi:hypothetical protein